MARPQNVLKFLATNLSLSILDKFKKFAVKVLNAFEISATQLQVAAHKLRSTAKPQSIFLSHLVRLDGQSFLGGGECFIQVVDTSLVGLAIVVDRLVVVFGKRLRDEVLRGAVRC